MALKEPEKALADMERVVQLKPQWPKVRLQKKEIHRHDPFIFVSDLGFLLSQCNSFGNEATPGRFTVVPARFNSRSRRFSGQTNHGWRTLMNCSFFKYLIVLFFSIFTRCCLNEKRETLRRRWTTTTIRRNYRRSFKN